MKMILVLFCAALSVSAFGKSDGKKRSTAAAPDVFSKIHESSLKSRARSCGETVDLVVETRRFGEAERKILIDKFGKSAIGQFDGSRLSITLPVGRLPDLLNLDFVSEVYENSLGAAL